MKELQKIITIVAVLVFISCNNHQSNSIQLNKGNKWNVNLEMKPHIESAQELLHGFVSQNDKDYQELAKNLKIQNNELINSCTMKGRAHDELHKWLYTHIQLIDNLSSSNNSDEAKEVILEIQKSFDNYKNFFQ